MPRYLIVRKFSVTEKEMPRSAALEGAQEGRYPEIIWEHSHVRRRRRRHGHDVLRLRGARRGDRAPARHRARGARVHDPARSSATSLPPTSRSTRKPSPTSPSSPRRDETRRVGQVVERLERDRSLAADLAAALVALRQELERIVVQRRPRAPLPSRARRGRRRRRSTTTRGRRRRPRASGTRASRPTHPSRSSPPRGSRRRPRAARGARARGTVAYATGASARA